MEVDPPSSNFCCSRTHYTMKKSDEEQRKQKGIYTLLDCIFQIRKMETQGSEVTCPGPHRPCAVRETLKCGPCHFCSHDTKSPLLNHDTKSPLLKS